MSGLSLIPQFIDAGINSFKVEGRMKTPEYVATVVSIYRKYIDAYLENGSYEVSKEDSTNLMQVFNRGSFSTGHLLDEPNSNLIYKEKSNNQGLFLGTVQSYAPITGHVKLKLETDLSIGDTISIASETGNYTVSELMIKKQNIPSAKSYEVVTIGRMKGNISIGDKIYKMSSQALNSKARQTFSGKELKKIPLNAILNVALGKPITLEIVGDSQVKVTSDVIPEEAKSSPITESRLIEQLSKTGNTPYEFKSIKVIMEHNLFVPSIGKINELRRLALEKYEESIKNSYKRDLVDVKFSSINGRSKSSKPKISILLNKLIPDETFSYLKKADEVYIPYSYFCEMPELVHKLCKDYNVGIYLPSIVQNKLENNFRESLNKIFSEFNIPASAVISNIGQISYIPNGIKKIANFSFNVFNSNTISELKNLGLSRITLSPELNKQTLNELSSISEIDTEILAYGRLPLMTMQYCPISNSNKCPTGCNQMCKNSSYELKDRMNFKFKIMSDSSQTITTLYNSKITWIPWQEIKTDFIRISFLDETETEKNNIIENILSGSRLESNDYTNGNFARNI